MTIEEKIARAVNEKFLTNGSKTHLLAHYFDEEVNLAIKKGDLTEENMLRVRAEAARIAVKLRLEVLRRRAS